MVFKYKKESKLEQLYDFDLENGFVEKESTKDFKLNPTAIIYVRVSDKKQVREGNGLDSQEKTCRDRATRNGVKVLMLFKDEGISGAKMERDGINAAVAYLRMMNKKTPQVTYFLCTEASRISRSESIDESGKLQKAIESAGVEIILTRDGTNISKKSSSEVFNTGVKFLMAMNERLQIKERSEDGIKAKLYDGEWCLAVPVGYERVAQRIDGKRVFKIERVEPESSIIKEGLELFASGVVDNQARLLEFFNGKRLKTNHRSPNPGNLRPSFIQRLFDVQKLYFYAGFIINPKYGILHPVVAKHEPIISMSTMGKILERLKVKSGTKVGVRKDNSDKFPLRGVLYCPECGHPMTGESTKGKMGVYYDYYSCKRKDCPHRESISVDVVHKQYKEMLSKLRVKPSMMKLVDGILNKSVQEKNKILVKLSERDKKEIAEIDIKIQAASDKLSKVTDERIIARIEKERGSLEDKKELLESKLKDYTIQQRDLEIISDRVKTMLTDPVIIWEHFPVSVKVLQAGVLFGGKILCSKKEGLRTPQISGLNNLISGINTDAISNGADYGIRTHDPLDHNQML